MAFRRSLATRLPLLTQRFHPSISHIPPKDEDNKTQSSPLPDSSQSSLTSFLRSRPTSGTGALFGAKGMFYCPYMGLGSSVCSYSSSTIGDGSGKGEFLSDVAEVLSENGVDAVNSVVAAISQPAVNEVAIAAADSYPPVALLQHLIDGVHCYTGLSWWASIALVTVIIRTATVPLLVYQLKCTTKLTLIRPHLEKIKEDITNSGGDPVAMAEGQKRMKKVFNEYGVTPFSPLLGIFIQGPIFMSFFFAITNMVEKVPSFKEGGAFWFTDLTTSDSLYIFPVLTAFTFLVTVECNMQEGMEGNPAAATMKKVSRVFAFLTVPLTMTFPKAIFCYWITSNLFSLMYGLVIKSPEVKNMLGVPIIPVNPNPAPHPAFSLFPSSQKSSSRTSSSDISQRLSDLEEQVKERNKDDKL